MIHKIRLLRAGSSAVFSASMGRMRNAILFLLTTVILSGPLGCVPFREQPLSPGEVSKGFASRTLSDEGLQSFLAAQGAAGGAWTPDRLALAAVYFRGDLAVARAEEEEAAARITTAGERPNPVLSFSPGYNATTSGMAPWIFTPTFDVTIETAGKRRKRVAGAGFEAEAARLRVVAGAWAVRTAVRDAMLDLYAGRRTSSLLKAEGALHEEELQMLQLQVDAGESAAFELTQTRLSLSRARLALHDAEKSSATALARLAAAVGVPSAAIDAATLDFSSFETLPRDPGEEARRQALINRADLLAVLADYAAADADLRLEIARQYPDIHLNPGYELDQTDNKWFLGFGIELPILNQNRGPIAEAEARRKKAGAAFEASQAAVFGEIELSRAAYRAARAKVDTASRLFGEAVRAADTTKRMVESGELGPLELTRRRIESSAAELELEKARIEAQQAAGALDAAVQVPNRKIE